MSQIARRLQRLEDEIGGEARTLVVFSGGATEHEVHEMLLRDHGIAVGRRDEVVHFVTQYELEDGSLDPNPAPPVYQPMQRAGDRPDRRSA